MERSESTRGGEGQEIFAIICSKKKKIKRNKKKGEEGNGSGWGERREENGKRARLSISG